jgi:hypothetical protein
VADALRTLQPLIEYTLDLEAARWELWFLVGEDEEPSPLQIRDAVRSLLKANPLIKGIKRIHDFYRSTIEVEEDGKTYTKPCVITNGSNLREVCKLPWVDIRHTTTNDLMEIYAIFGINAICSAIEQNLLQVMSSNSAEVSRTYIHIIAHEMCRTGAPCALTFNGLTNSKTSTLKLATFERSLESFIRAACIGHTDHLRGISESVIVGKPVSVGTGGDFELIDDERATIIPTTTTSTHMNIYPYPPIPSDVTEDTNLPLIAPMYVHKPPLKRKRDISIKSTPIPQKKPKSVQTATQNPFMGPGRMFVPYVDDNVSNMYIE